MRYVLTAYQGDTFWDVQEFIHKSDCIAYLREKQIKINEMDEFGVYYIVEEASWL